MEYTVKGDIWTLCHLAERLHKVKLILQENWRIIDE